MSNAAVANEPDHRLPLGEGWRIWRLVCVRGAGFPAEQVMRLGSVDAEQAVARLIDAEDRLGVALAQALQSCDAANSPDLPITEARALGRALRRLRGKQVPEPFEAPAGVEPALARLREAQDEVNECRLQATALFAKGTVATGETLREIARDRRFRSAVLWQNPSAVRGTIEALLRRPAGAVDSKTREHERLVASYLQRYCVKNDTVGFFGPVGWGELGPSPTAVALRPGPSLLKRRTVYFESWGIQVWAAQLTRSSELRRVLAPRPLPTFRLEGTRLHHLSGKVSELPIEYARLLALCDGERSARELAVELLRDPTLAIRSDSEIYQMLDELAEKRVVAWAFEVPTTEAHPERRIRQLIEAAPPGEERRQALEHSDALEATRGAVAAAADNPETLEGALGQLEATFARITGVAGVRRGGEAYAGRTLVFEDCLRDLQLELGAPFLQRLAPPLRLLLVSARWYTHTIAQRFRRVFLESHRAIVTRTGVATVGYLSFWEEIEKHFTGSQFVACPVVAGVQRELHERWAGILALDPTERSIELVAPALAPAVAAAFAAPGPGWPGARHHSPDLLIAAAGASALEAGRYLTVLGELHTGENTLCNPVFVNQHPAPRELMVAVERDLPEPRIQPVVPKERSTRADQFSIARHDFDVEIGSTRSPRPRGQVLPVSAFVVEESDGDLIVRTRDGRLRFDVVAFFEYNLKLESLAHFTIMPALPHSPRVTIDGLVVARERWRFNPAELGFAQLPDALDRFAAVTRWARQVGLPRFLFVKIPEEIKPCYLDLASPVYVEIFIKLVRRASVVSVSEMLPAPDATWLADAAGNHYTCELRLVTVDPEPWRSSNPSLDPGRDAQ